MSDALNAALAAEHAAVFGYGVVGAHLTKSERAAAEAAEATHRNRRDAVMLRLVAASATPAAASAAYDLPFPVDGRDDALRLAVALKEGTAKAWHQALAGTNGDERKLALDALTDCAVRATRWRKTAKISPSTVPFPGAPA